MPLGFDFYPDMQLLFIRGEGVITQQERVLTMLAWLQDPAYEGCLDALFDISAARSTPKLAELRELIGILERHLPGRGPRRLAIVTSKPITFAVARIFGDLIQIERVPLEVKVFLDREKAWSWLRPDALREPM